MAFSLNFNDVFESNNRIADGTYEVVINWARENATPGGAEFIEFDLIVRNDVDQPYKNAHIFHKVWKSKADGKYNMKQFNTIAKACKLENGKSYASINDLLLDFTFKTAQVTIKNETSEYMGKTYENTNVKFWNESRLIGCNHTFKNTTPKTMEIDNNDLPF